MSVSTLTIPTPKRCSICRLVTHVHPEYQLYCVMVGDVTCYKESCHLDCPLNIQPEGLRWIRRITYKAFECPNCHVYKENTTPYCPSCGVKLDLPETTEEVAARLMDKHGKAANERLKARLEEQRKLDPPEEE